MSAFAFCEVTHVSVGAVNLGTVKAGSDRVLGGLDILADEALNVLLGKGSDLGALVDVVRGTNDLDELGVGDTTLMSVLPHTQKLTRKPRAG